MSASLKGRAHPLLPFPVGFPRKNALREMDGDGLLKQAGEWALRGGGGGGGTYGLYNSFRTGLATVTIA